MSPAEGRTTRPTSAVARILRNPVLRVAVLYLVVAAGTILIVDTAFPLLGVADWAVTLVAVVALIGFPLALVLAWYATGTYAREQGSVDDADLAGRAGALRPLPGLEPDDPLDLDPLPARAVVLLGVVFLLLLAVSWAAFRYGPIPPEATVDPNTVAVFPFSVGGADPSYRYLGEGMVDLLSTKLNGEGGPRAVDSRAALSAWRRAAATAGGDLPADSALAVARRLGAGQVLTGGIVGTPANLVISATLTSIDGRRERAEASASGPADSLPVLVDRLAAALLSQYAGEEGHRLDQLTSTSLPALRAYLEGQADYRRGRYEAAAAHFDAALQFDSAFALAALGLASAGGWTSDPSPYWRGLDLAWAARDRLGRRDRAYLHALAGPRYPEESPADAHIRSAEIAVRLAPDRPEAWYAYGDELYHRGREIGIADIYERAGDAFREAVRLDSTFAAPLTHLVEFAAIAGDTATVRRLGSLYLAQDSTGETAEYLRWRIALALGDDAELQRVRSRFDSLQSSTLSWIIAATQVDGIASADAERAMAILEARPRPQDQQLDLLMYKYGLALNRGRPAEAVEITRAFEDMPDAPRMHLRMRTLDALYWDGDSTAGAAAARELARFADAPLAADASERDIQFRDICALEQWRLWRGETASALTAAAKLRSAAEPQDSAWVVQTAHACAAVIEALRKTIEDDPDALAAVERLERLLRTAPNGLVGSYANLVVARLREAHGDPEGALAAVRRRWESADYIAPHLLLEARLAAATGDSAGAIRSYEQYLALRYDPEPALDEEMEQVRGELARLRGEPPR